MKRLRFTKRSPKSAEIEKVTPNSVTKPKSTEKIDNHHETYIVINAVTIVTLVQTSYILLLRNEILTCVELYYRLRLMVTTPQEQNLFHII